MRNKAETESTISGRQNGERHRPEPDPAAPAKVSRSNFIKLGLSFLSTLAVLEIAGASLLYLKPRSLEGKFGGTVTAGSIDTFPLGSVTAFPEGRFFLVRAHNGGFLAVYSRCPHLGCTVNWEAYNERFYCPCHASSFDLYGNYESAPVPRALDIFSLRIENSVVTVDPSLLHRRENFTADQLVYV